MRDAETIKLRMELANGVLGIATPAGAVRLGDDVSEGLVEQVAVLPRSTPVRLEVDVRSGDLGRERIAAIVHHHFAMLRERTEYRLTRTRRAGQLSLFVGVLVLLGALGAAKLLSNITSGGFAVVVEEGLTIVGWVALWRPLDLLLFERWSLKREIALYRRLEAMEVSCSPSPQ